MGVHVLHVLTATELTGKGNVMSAGDVVEGRIAKGAIAEYRFEGVTNSPVLLRTPKTGNEFSYFVKVYKDKKIVYNTKYGSNLE